MTTWACTHMTISGPIQAAPTTGCGCAMHRVAQDDADTVICHPWMGWLCRADRDCRRPLVCRVHDAALHLSHRLHLIGG